MPIYVSRHHVHDGVVREWKRLMVATARERGDDLSIVRPFHPFEQTYSEVLAEVKSGCSQGLEFYRRMILFTPGFTFHEDDIVLFVGKAELVSGLDEILQTLREIGKGVQFISHLHTPQVTFHYIPVTPQDGPESQQGEGKKEPRTHYQGPNLVMPSDIPLSEYASLWLLEKFGITDEIRSFTGRDYQFNARLVPRGAPLQDLLRPEYESGQFPIPDSLVIVGEVKQGQADALRGDIEGEIIANLGLDMLVYNVHDPSILERSEF